MSEQRKYRSWTAKQKLEIVLAGLKGDRSVRDVCREHGISETLYYGWRDKLFEAGRPGHWPRLFYFVRPEAEAAAQRLFGRSEFRRILVVGRLGARGRDEVVAYARERRVEIVEFPEVLKYLLEHTPTRGKAPAAKAST